MKSFTGHSTVHSEEYSEEKVIIPFQRKLQSFSLMQLQVKYHNENIVCSFIIIVFALSWIFLSIGLYQPMKSEAAITPLFSNCGIVTINGSVGSDGAQGICDTTATRFSWDWGDGTIENMLIRLTSPNGNY